MPKLISVLACCLLLSALLPEPAAAQKRQKPIKQRFKAAAILGATTSQLDGDTYEGFDKANLQFGLSGVVVFTRQVSLCTELLYVGKGSRTPTNRNRVVDRLDRTIDLTYIEVPIYVRYALKEKATSPFFEIGAAFGRLTNTKITEPDSPRDDLDFRAFQADFRSNEVSFLAGFGIPFNQYLGIKLRYSIGLTSFYDAEPTPIQTLNFGTPPEVTILRNYALGIALYCQI